MVYSEREPDPHHTRATRMEQFRRFQRERIKGTIYHGDALEFLKSRKSKSAGIVFLDPPFNLGKRYSDSAPNLDSRPDHDYQAWMREVLNESVRVLKDGGALYLYHIPQWALRFGAELDGKLNFRHWISVAMKNGFARGNRLYPAHYALLYYTKGEPAVFRRPKLRPSLCRHCGKLIKNYGGYTPIIEEKGINLSDVWDDVSPVRHKTTKNRVANELPLRMMRRVIDISGASNELFLDPFSGSGSGVLAAVLGGMRFLSCDLVADNCALLCDRLVSLTQTDSGA